MVNEFLLIKIEFFFLKLRWLSTRFNLSWRISISVCRRIEEDAWRINKFHFRSKRNGTTREIVPETIQPFDTSSTRTE